MGVVYEAMDERLGRSVAIKTVRPGVDAEARNRLWREARAAAAVSHPNICQIYEIGEDGDEIFLAMERLQGEPLTDRIARGPLSLEEAVPLALEILGALQALHQRDVVHRDLKPSNVFLTAHGIKLLDFGLARPGATTAGDATLTQPGYVMGTPRYMAPEQWRGEPADPRTDLFAVGALVFEMLTGRPAFVGETAIEIYHAVLHERPPALAGGGAVTAVDRVLHRALSKRREDRFDSADDMARELRGALTQGSGVTKTQHEVRAMKRVIVLPFRMLRPDAEVDFLAFSLPDAVTASLSGLGSMVVRSSHAAARFTDEAVNLKKVASEAEVDAVLLGTLLRAGDQVRVSAQLVEVPAGTIVWSKTAQVAMQDLFQLQDELAQAIVGSLSVPLSTGERHRLQHDQPANARAYEFYLRANQLAEMSDTGKMDLARQLYESALAEDPNFAPAWARHARACRVIAKYGSAGAEGPRLIERAREGFDRALKLSPDLPILHHLYTHFQVEIGQSRDALRRLLAQTRIRPSDPDLYSGLVVATRYCGLMEASLAADAAAKRLDPGARTSVLYTHMLRCDWEKAKEFGEDPFIRYYVLPMLGRTDEALEIYRKLSSDDAPFVVRVVLRSLIAAHERDPVACYEALRPLIDGTHPFTDPEGIFMAARALARAGNLPVALDTLEQVVEAGFTCPTPLKCDPWLDSLRGEPRFGEIVRRAEEGRRAAAVDYLELGGEQILGVSV